MGASVNIVVEYRQYDTFFSFGEIELLRDVEFFCAIAWGDGGITRDMPYPPRKSFPSDASFSARRVFFVVADEVREYLEASKLDEEPEMSLEEYAQSHGEWAVKEYAKSGLLPPPEMTDLGWLTLSETKANLAQRGVKAERLMTSTKAMLAAMNELAASYGRDGVRILFWFGM